MEEEKEKNNNKEKNNEKENNNKKENHNENEKNIFKKLAWQEWTLIIATAIVFILYAAYISNYNQLPSPIYGGDLYRDRGFIQNIIAGNPIYSDGFYANEIQYYPYLIFAVEAGIVKLTSASIDSVFLFFPLLTLIFGSLVWYLLGNRVFKSKTWGMMTALAFIFSLYVSNPKGANVALFVFIPAFFYFWLKYEQETKILDAAFAGLFLGLVCLTWGGIFLACCGFLCLTALYFYLEETIKDKEKGFSKYIKNLWKYIKKYYLIAIIAFVIAMTFFGPLMIKYHMTQYNEVTKWGDTKLELLGPLWVLNILKNMFFNTTNVITFLTGIIGLVGLLVLIFAKKSKEMVFVLCIFVSNILIMQHHLITKPLLNISFLPEKLIYLMFLFPLFFVYGVKTFSQFFKDDKQKKIVLIIAGLLLVFTLFSKIDQQKNDTWEKVGFQDKTYITSLYELGDYLENNMQKDQTILSNDETGFMLAVVSGRKVVLTRRTHASYYIDIDKRIAEASVAMYGDDLNLTKEILKKYKVKYFYVDQQLLQNPMRVRTDLKDYLIQYNVSFTEVYDRYDIALPPERANMLNLLIIPPKQPSADFMSLWNKEFAVQVDGQIIGELYVLKE